MTDRARAFALVATATLALALLCAHTGIPTGASTAWLNAALDGSSSSNALTAASALCVRVGVALFGPSDFAARIVVLALTVASACAVGWSALRPLGAQRATLVTVAMLTMPLGFGNVAHPSAGSMAPPVFAALFALALRLHAQRTVLAFVRGAMLAVALAPGSTSAPLSIAAGVEALAHRAFPWTGLVALGVASLLRARRSDRDSERQFAVESLLTLAMLGVICALRPASETALALYAAPLALSIALWLGDGSTARTAPWIILGATAIVARDLATYPWLLHSLDGVRGSADQHSAATVTSAAPWWAIAALTPAFVLYFAKQKFGPWWITTVALAVSIATFASVERDLSEQSSSQLAARAYLSQRASSDEPCALLAPSLGESVVLRRAIDAGSMATAEIAANWLTEANVRRWIIVRSSQLAALNAAMRSRTGHNLALHGGSLRGWLLASSSRSGSIAQPLDEIVSDQPFAAQRGEGVRVLAPAPRFDRAFELRSASTQLRGRRASIALDLAVLDRVDGDYTVFVHGDGPCPRINADHAPAKGLYPTTSWRAGEFVRDRFELEIPWHCPAGDYRVFVGLFRGDARMHVTQGAHDGEHRVHATTVTVR